jgi:hypothetical protein
MWGIATKKIGRVAVKEQGKSDILLFSRSLTSRIEKGKHAKRVLGCIKFSGLAKS